MKQLPYIALIATTLLLFGCAHQPAPATATGAAAQLPGDHARTARYRIDINYPDLPPSAAPLSAVLHKTGQAAKRDFLRAIPDPQQFPEFADRQMQLQVDFAVAARTPRFVSVHETGASATGGAHPIPIDGSFVYDNHTRKIITLDDLFTNPAQARGRFSKLARKTLQSRLLTNQPDASDATPEARRQWRENMLGMIQDGTRPTPQNFSEFIIQSGPSGRASGLRLIFSAYQVAPYVYGAQTVDIPARTFTNLLKPSYKSDFSSNG